MSLDSMNLRGISFLAKQICMDIFRTNQENFYLVRF